MSVDIRNIFSKLKHNIRDEVTGNLRIRLINEFIDTLSFEELNLLRSLFNRILSEMRNLGASDLELGGHGTWNYIWMRIDGTKRRIDKLPKFDCDESALVILSILSKDNREHLLKNFNLDFSYAIAYDNKNIRFRLSAYFEMNTLALNSRAITDIIINIKDLGFHPNVLNYMNHAFIKSGLTLITGITGSGKSTTLDSIIDFNNNSVQAHIVIISSPVEYVHKSNKCVVRHREVGSDVLSFKDGVIEAMRQDPDIVVIGEMRDPDTILAALELADTGHKIFSTLHTSSAVESIARILSEVDKRDVERVRNRLADVLTAVVSQKLVPRIQGGRILAKEVLLITPGIRAAIKNNNIEEIYMMINQNSGLGMITLEKSLLQLYKQGLISKENAFSYANNKEMMTQLMRI